MSIAKVSQKLRAGEPSLGAFLGFASPGVAECLAHAGFDWLVIEAEHNAIDLPRIEHMLMAVGATPVVPLVRVPDRDPGYIQRVLDIGALGIVAPMIRTADDARALVAATRYPPAGIRGYGPLRASRYTLNGPDYFKSANESVLVIPIIETADAIRNIDEIAAVDGIDVLFMGTFDLSLSMDLDPMKQPHPQVDDAVLVTIEAAQRHGKAVGAIVAEPDQVNAKIEQGFRMVGFTDYLLLCGAARRALGSLPNRVG